MDAEKLTRDETRVLVFTAHYFLAVRWFIFCMLGASAGTLAAAYFLSRWGVLMFSMGSLAVCCGVLIVDYYSFFVVSRRLPKVLRNG